MEKEIKATKVINSDVYCSKCGEFLGMTCDPFRKSYHESCFPDKQTNPLNDNKD